MSTYKTGMVFGVFDRLHKGHEYFLSRAQKQCNKLIVVVTPDEVVLKLKQKKPSLGVDERVAKIVSFILSAVVVEGDKDIGSWQVLKVHTPDVVFLGYDQQGIAKEMEALNQSYEYIDSFQPERYKTSLL
ncbi:MAG: adenylyltransferase/cytidyltransferase family protein [Candidatus Paceibacterota bacterium]